MNIDSASSAQVISRQFLIENLLGNVVKYNQMGTMAEVEVRQTCGLAEMYKLFKDDKI